MSKTSNIVLLGIGGQGALTLMEMLAIAAEKADEEVRVLSRVSLARLGGSAMCHIRLGPAASPAIPIGEADILLALEMSEVLRALPMAHAGALAFINTYRRLPIAAGVAGIHYPTRAEVEEALRASGITGVFVPESLPASEDEMAERRGRFIADPVWGTGISADLSARINMIMLGVLCGYTNILPRPALEEAIAQRLPAFAEQNLQTFARGWRFGEAMATTRSATICYDPPSPGALEM